jgi:peptidoglycan pentaglycine glycine transferase (the first glycine)
VIDRDCQSCQKKILGEAPLNLLSSDFGVDMQLSLRDDNIDPEWDEFVGTHPLGFPTQTATYARVRAKSGMKSLRVCLHRDGRIIAGAQLQWRSIPGIGRWGSVEQGPVVDPSDQQLVRRVLEEADRAARRIRMKLLRVGCYAAQPVLNAQLAELGFRPSAHRWAEAKTCLVDLTRPEHDILAAMRKKTRYNVGLSARKGMVTREGSDADLPEFYRLLSETAAHQGFPVHPLSYFKEIYARFAPQKMGLILASFEGKPVAASLVIIAGTRAMDAWGGFTEQHRDLKPNEAVIWGAIRWAKARGCEVYDLLGLPDDSDDGVGVFKSGFGQVQELPEAYDKFYGCLAPVWRRAFSETYEQPFLRRVVGAIKDRLFERMAN